MGFGYLPSGAYEWPFEIVLFENIMFNEDAA